MTDEVKKFILDHFPDYDETTLYSCTDGVTWLFKTKSSSQTHVVFRDVNTGELKIIDN